MICAGMAKQCTVSLRAHALPYTVLFTTPKGEIWFTVASIWPEPFTNSGEGDA